MLQGEYEILSADDPADLAEVVNNYLEDGYRLAGGLGVDSQIFRVTYHQAVYRDQDE